mmetsp:Transcript_32510/g.71768  ORF Transcript_32510/g.71768 Transcript_32510/m.71768 type:complete len:451 (+) Transcript_32510:122-1474(+)
MCTAKDNNMTDQNTRQSAKVFIGGLSWETTGEKLRAYFENYGVVREAFVSYNRNNGRPRGFGFVVFESPEVADKVVASKHTIDRREVEAKKAVPKEEQQQSSTSPPSSEGSVKTKKIFVGGLAPSVDEKMLRQYFEQFGIVEDAVVMYDHENKRPRGFGFVTFAAEESVDKVFGRGVMQSICDKQIEIKPAVPRDQMPPAARVPNSNTYYDQRNAPFVGPRSNTYPYGPQPGVNNQTYNQLRGYGARNFVPTVQPGLGPRGPRGFNGAQGLGQMPAGFPSQGARSYGASLPSGLPSKTVPVPAGPYDIYAGGLPNGTSMFNANSQAALYNLANLQQAHLNGMQGAGTGAAAGKLNAAAFGAAAAAANNINLKALGALASSFGAFPNSQADPSAYQDDTAYSQQADADYAEAAAAAVNLNQAAAGLAVAAADYNSFHDASFSTAPAPGWSS